MPLATAIAGALRTGDRPTTPFWLCSGIGSAIVVLFTVITGDGTLQIADLALLGAVVAAAVGYAEGGTLIPPVGGMAGNLLGISSVCSIFGRACGDRDPPTRPSRLMVSMVRL
ncbi:hypothetical protein PN499_22850 [Kamptonema animale CS-326]|uniref:hypothetical protein n=1 Tax=Kamptonema animale TaxID=92934 RepID=UPI00232AFA90|nr:hypothetical protein [Kamptonema animale]MDB9514042.1 hypothetical protein [Kamptonema animale CS-326]